MAEGMSSFKHEYSDGSIKETVQQTPAKNSMDMEAKFVPVDGNPVPTPDMGLPPVNEKIIGQVASEGREAIGMLGEANVAKFNADKERNDLLAVKGADEGVINGSLRIINFLSENLNKHSEKLVDRSKRRAETVSQLEQKVLERRYNQDYTGVH